MDVYLFGYMYVCYVYVETFRGQKFQIPWNESYRWLWAILWVQWTYSGSPARIINAFKYFATSIVLECGISNVESKLIYGTTGFQPSILSGQKAETGNFCL